MNMNNSLYIFIPLISSTILGLFTEQYHLASFHTQRRHNLAANNSPRHLQHDRAHHPHARWMASQLVSSLTLGKGPLGPALISGYCT